MEGSVLHYYWDSHSGLHSPEAILASLKCWQFPKMLSSVPSSGLGSSLLFFTSSRCAWSPITVQDTSGELNTVTQANFTMRLLSSKLLCVAWSTLVITECQIPVVFSSLNIWSNELTHFLICRILSSSECLPVLHVRESVTKLLNPIHVSWFSAVEHPVYLIIYFFFESYMTFNQKPQSGN